MSLENFRLVLQIAYGWSHEQQAKIVVFKFFLQFHFEINFQNVYVIPRLPISNFWTQKNADKNFGKNLLNIQKMNT